MSKTRRRKNVGFGSGKKSYGKWVLNKYVYNISMPVSWIPYTDKELKVSINKYHSDAGCGEKLPVPAWYRREEERRRRRKIKAETNRILRTGDYENYEYPNLKNDIIWKWW